MSVLNGGVGRNRCACGIRVVRPEPLIFLGLQVRGSPKDLRKGRTQQIGVSRFTILVEEKRCLFTRKGGCRYKGYMFICFSLVITETGSLWIFSSFYSLQFPIPDVNGDGIRRLRDTTDVPLFFLTPRRTSVTWVAHLLVSVCPECGLSESVTGLPLLLCRWFRRVRTPIYP